MTAFWPLPIASDARLSAGTLAWSTPQGQFVTVVAKLTLAADVSGRLSVVAPRPLATRDELEGGHPAKSVVVPADVAPFAPAGEVVLRGSAWQAGGVAAATKAVTLAVYRGQKPLVTKVLHVYGDRVASAPRDVQPFTSMPVVWERAVSDATNPIGLGVRGPGALPNVIHPTSPGTAAGFCAIPRGWQIRKSLLAGATMQCRGELVIELPAAFPFSYYQCAPADQRTPQLEGDEWIVVEGMHPERQSFHARLPGLRAAAMAVRSSARAPIDMKLDLVCVDMASLELTLTFRGMAPVTRDEAVSFTVTLDDRGSLSPWPEAPAPTSRRLLPSVPPPDVTKTHELSDVAQVAAGRLGFAPFPVGAPRAGMRAEVPGAPWAAPAAPALAAGERGSTVALATPRHIDVPRPVDAPRDEASFTPRPAAPPAAAPEAVAPAPAPKPEPPPAPKPRKAPKRAAKGTRRPRTIEAMEEELLARGLAREDVQAIIAALKT